MNPSQLTKEFLLELLDNPDKDTDLETRLCDFLVHKSEFIRKELKEFFTLD